MINIIKNIKKIKSININHWSENNTSKYSEELIYSSAKGEYCNPKNIEEFPVEHFAASKENIPSFYARKIKNGKCFTGNALVLSPDNIPFNEYTVEEKHPLRNKRCYKFNNPLKIEGRVALLSTDPNNINFYHWMIESFPKFHLVQKSGFEVDKYIICNKMPYQKQLLEKAGIKDNQIIWFDENTFIQADELIAPDIINNFKIVEINGKACYNAKYIPTWIFDFYKELLVDELKEANPRKIFISREKAKYRNIINEKELFDMLEQKGFKKVFLEEMTIFEQANLFYNAEFVVSPHGAGLTNLLFCRANTKVIEFFSPTYLCNNQQLIAKSLNLDYAYVICEPDRNILDQDVLKENLIADINKIEKSFTLFN